MEPTGLTFQKEQPQKFIVDMWPLLRNHFEEVGTVSGQLQPNLEMYQLMHDAGKLIIFTIRDEGELIGYSLFLIDKHIHIRDALCARQDILYVKPERRGFLSLRFMKWCEKRLKKLGVKIIFTSTTTRLDFGTILKRTGYKAIETVYSKDL